MSQKRYKDAVHFYLERVVCARDLSVAWISEVVRYSGVIATTGTNRIRLLAMGHSIISVILYYICQDINKEFVEVVRLEIPCRYRLYGPKGYIDRLREIVISL